MLLQEQDGSIIRGKLDRPVLLMIPCNSERRLESARLISAAFLVPCLDGVGS